MVMEIKIAVNDEVLTVRLEQNVATEALVERLEEGEVVVEAREYGGFEKVGELGFRLPTQDAEMKTRPGDVMLYQGDQMTIFYGSNAWSYTKLGEVMGEAKGRLASILGKGDVKLRLSL